VFDGGKGITMFQDRDETAARVDLPTRRMRARRITWGFNLGPFLLVLVVQGGKALRNRDQWPDLNSGTVLTAFLIVLVFFWLVAVFIAILQEFWNRFISDVFKVRPINKAESCAILLMAALFL